MTSEKSDVEQEPLKKIPRKKRKRLKMVIAFTIIIILILVSLVSYWHFYLRPITLEELGRREFKNGDSINLKGTITEIEKHNTTYGPLTLISLDNYDPESFVYKLVVDSDNDYKVGDDYKTRLTFEEYNFNGIKITTGDKLFNTYFMPIYMGKVINGVSFNSGILLVQKSIDDKGTTVFEVVTKDNYGFPLNLFNISLRKGSTLTDDSYDHRDSLSYFGEEYSHVSGHYYKSDETDFMESLEDIISENRMIEFSDVDSNSLLNDGDVLKIHIPPTKNKQTIETYCLHINHSWYSVVSGVKYLINWDKGIYEWTNEPEDRHIILQYVNSELNGMFTNSTLRISRVLGDVPLQYKDFELRLFDKNDIPILKEKIMDGKLIESENDDKISVEYIDKNYNNLLDKDDLFIINGLKNQIRYELEIVDRDHALLAIIKLVAGYDQIIGHLPKISLEDRGLMLDGENKYKFEVVMSHWHPQLILNSTLYFQIYLDYDDDLASEFIIKSGFVGAYNGVNITFFDADNDNYLSIGDYFIMEPEKNRLFQMSVLFFKEEIADNNLSTNDKKFYEV